MAIANIKKKKYSISFQNIIKFFIIIYISYPQVFTLSKIDVCYSVLKPFVKCIFNIQRNGADFSVFVNTGNEFDGSDSGARPDEAISWGKIKPTAKPVKVN